MEQRAAVAYQEDKEHFAFLSRSAANRIYNRRQLPSSVRQLGSSPPPAPAAPTPRPVPSDGYRRALEAHRQAVQPVTSAPGVGRLPEAAGQTPSQPRRNAS
jgi:hypothetical protein